MLDPAIQPESVLPRRVCEACRFSRIGVGNSPYIKLQPSLGRRASAQWQASAEDATRHTVGGKSSVLAPRPGDQRRSERREGIGCESHATASRAAINPLLDDQMESRSGLGRGVQQDQVEVENPYGSQRETPPIYWTV